MNTRQRALNRNTAASYGVTVVEQLDIMAIFWMFTKKTLHQFLENVGHTFMFPFAAAMTIIQAALALRQAYLDGGKATSLVKAIAETITAVVITAAVIGGFVAGAIFAIAAPIMFTAILGLKSLYHAGMATFFWSKSTTTNNPVLKEKLLFEAQSNAMSSVSLALGAIAIGMVMVAGKFVFAGMGVVSAAIAIGYTLYKAFLYHPTASNQGHQPARANANNDADDENDLTSNSKLHKQLGITDTVTHGEKIEAAIPKNAEATTSSNPKQMQLTQDEIEEKAHQRVMDQSPSYIS